MSFAHDLEAATPTPSPEDRARPWWRYPIVWMVVSGPALVVVASFITLYLVITHPDPVLDTSDDPVKAGSLAPAMHGRNHAAQQALQPRDK